jgi:hypothetical protein
MCKKCYPDGLLVRAGRVKQCLTHKVDKTAPPKNSNGRAKKRKAFEKWKQLTILNAKEKNWKGMNTDGMNNWSIRKNKLHIKRSNHWL